MSPGVWREIEDTRLAPHLLTREEADAIDERIWAVQGSKSVVQIWTSAAFDGRYMYLGPGGGHRAYNGNELYRFDFENLVWDRMYDPSPIAYMDDSGDGIPVWGPKAIHHYDGLIYVPKVNAILVIRGQCWRFDLDRADDPPSAWVQVSCPPFHRAYLYFKTAILPDNGNVLVYGGGLTNVGEYDPVTDTYSRIGGEWDLVNAAYSVADIDPARRRVYSINASGDDQGVLQIDIDADPLASGASIIPNSIPPEGVGNNSCFLHHPPSGLMVAWNGGREIYTFDPDGPTWTTIPNTVGPAPTSSHENGPFQKCAYLEQYDVFAFYNNENEGMWLYKLP